MALNPKQQRFIAEYLTDLNATQAAIRSGYSPKTARVHASRLLMHVDIAAAIAAGKAKQLDKADLTASRVLEELRRVAFSDLSQFMDDGGKLKGLHELSPEQAACVASVEVLVKNAAAGDGHTDVVHKVKLWDKVRSLEQLAKHFALLTEKVEHSGDITYRWQE